MRRRQKTSRPAHASAMSAEPMGETGDADPVGSSREPPRTTPTDIWIARLTVVLWIAGLLAFSVYAGATALRMRQPPGCLYGCDVYFHKGLVESYLHDPNPFVAHTATGELAYYPGLMHA